MALQLLNNMIVAPNEGPGQGHVNGGPGGPNANGASGNSCCKSWSP